MFCAQCGEPVFDAARFCNHCGAALPTASTVAGSMPGGGPSGPGTAASGSAEPEKLGPATGGLIGRVRNILLSPATEWPVIASEPSSPGALYLRWVAPLVAIGVVATFIGHTLVGLPLIGRVGIGVGLAHAVFSYALSFLGVFLIALIVDLLAPSFGGTRDALAALKLMVYSFTPAWIAGVFNIVPILGVLAIVGALYGLYLLYLGLPVMMRCPRDRSVSYAVVTLICAIVAWVAIAALTTCAVGGLGLIGARALSRMGG